MRGGTGTTTHPPRQQSVRSVRTTVAAGRRCPAGIIQPGHDCPGYNTPSSYTSDGKRLNVGWNSCPKTYRHRHFLNPRFVARAPHGDSLPICARTVSRQAPSADKPRGSHMHCLGHRALANRSWKLCRNFIPTLRAPLMLSSTPYFVYLPPISFFVGHQGLENERGTGGIVTSTYLYRLNLYFGCRRIERTV